MAAEVGGTSIVTNPHPGGSRWEQRGGGSHRSEAMGGSSGDGGGKGKDKGGKGKDKGGKGKRYEELAVAKPVLE